MAALTVIAKLPAMHVIRSMATCAGTGQVDYFLYGAFMTRRAGKIRMRPVDHKLCLQIMIKLPDWPIDCVVTITASRTQRFVMCVIRAMAIDALARRIAEPG